MNSVAEMREAVFFEPEHGGGRYSRFWMLLLLASVIAAAGVVGQSTATVIGAMIVAPLMTPILGVVLATVLGDRRNLLRSWALVIAGALCAVAVGYTVGLFVASPVVAATNTEVAGRVSPDLIDLLAALATGAVGAIALVRKDISDTLPGVAIAISLVPPLSVVGLTLESRAWQQSLGALLLFLTNVTAILAVGVIVLAACRVGFEGETGRSGAGPGRLRLRPVISIMVTLVIIGIPLAASSVHVTQQSVLESRIRQAAVPWARQNHWDIAGLQANGDTAVLTLTGAPPVPDTGALVTALKSAGVDPAAVTVEFIPAYEVHLSDGASEVAGAAGVAPAPGAAGSSPAAGESPVAR